MLDASYQIRLYKKIVTPNFPLDEFARQTIHTAMRLASVENVATNTFGDI